jgi:hypothetical protein
MAWQVNGRGNLLRWPRNTLYLQRLALTLPTSGGRSVSIVHLWTAATEFSFYDRYAEWRLKSLYSLVCIGSCFLDGEMHCLNIMGFTCLGWMVTKGKCILERMIYSKISLLHISENLILKCQLRNKWMNDNYCVQIKNIHVCEGWWNKILILNWYEQMIIWWISRKW